MSYKELFKEENIEAEERFDLAIERIKSIIDEKTVPKVYQDYFSSTAKLIIYITNILNISKNDEIRNKSLEELQEMNDEMFASLYPDNYDSSFANPAHMEECFGEIYGKYLGYLYVSIFKMIPYAIEYRMKEVTIFMELFIEIYNIFESEDLSEANLKDTIYWFESDYSDVFLEDSIRCQLDTSLDFYYNILMESDLDDIRYLYFYGKYVSKNEVETANYLRKLSTEKIEAMASTFTEGFARGFELGRKDMSKKKYVEVRYPLGFERMVRVAVKQFKKMGLETIIRPATISSTPINKQMTFDHKFDAGLFLDKAMSERKLSVVRVTMDKYKDLAELKAGPAVIETFGETPFEPVATKGAVKLNEKQSKIYASYQNSYVQILCEYVKRDETSFTIIAYPIPEIGPLYETLFNETIRINTLDNDKFQKIQQKIIDALDKGTSVHVLGKGDNATDITIALHTLKNSEIETNFENCTADVNIPVGEVFTSPKLKGTNGILNVSGVYLDGIKYNNLKISFEDGIIKDYTCDNYEEKEKAKAFIKENLLGNRETLPIGEFAIGTNTTAYVMANKYNIVYKLPILIVEKMGPHFAIGDTCYSHEEDIMTYNPDGKAIVARENEYSALRHEKPEEAYFGCHTDITIPYDELEEIAVILPDGEKIIIIKDGRFVLDGTRDLNEPFENN
ncbi:MAG: aminopeptidase [Clostridiales bacterium]|nr:aminopeptidase [Clostridiales bacterium]